MDDPRGDPPRTGKNRTWKKRYGAALKAGTQQVADASRGLRDQFDAHLCFVVALCASLGIAIGVPQVSHLWQSAFTPFEHRPVFFWVFNLALATFYFASLFVVFRTHDPEQKRESPGRRPGVLQAGGRVVQRVAAWTEIIASWLPDLHARVFGHRTNRVREKQSAVLLVVLGLLTSFIGAEGDRSRLVILGGALCSNFAALFLILGAWLSFAKADVTKPHTIGGMVGRGISWATFTLALGEAIWLVAESSPGGWMSHRIYSIWAVEQVFATIVLLALSFDRLHAQTTRFPVRPIAVLVVSLFLVHYQGAQRIEIGDERRFAGSSSTPAPAPALAAPGLALPQTNPWLDRMEERLDSIAPNEPVVLVAASGGGSRAAIFTALVLEGLERTPLFATSDAADSAERAHTVADNIILLSAVSGGSLATADYLVERARGRHLDRVEDSARVTDRDELRQAIERDVESQVKELEDDIDVEMNLHGGAAALADEPTAAQPMTHTPAQFSFEKEQEADVAQVLERDRDWTRRLSAIAQRDVAGKQALESSKQLNHEILVRLAATDQSSLEDRREVRPEEPVFDVTRSGAWAIDSRAFDRMCVDFMAPLLRGVLAVKLNRGDALARFWNEKFDWHSITSTTGFAAAEGVSTSFAVANLPLVFFNASDVARGGRVVIGFPRVSADWFPNPQDAKALPHWPVAAEVLEPRLDIALARAVRMSSNFPFGFAPFEFADDENRTRVLDGGIVDNTGIDSLLAFFQLLQRAPIESRERALLDRLAKHGVVLIEIDAGARSSRKIRDGVFRTFGDAVQALSNSADRTARRNHDGWIDEIKKILGDASAVSRDAERNEDGEKPNPFFWCGFHCGREGAGSEDDSDEQVMTAWTLGPRDKARTLTNFLVAFDEWQDRMVALRQWMRSIHTVTSIPPATVREIETAADPRGKEKQIVPHKLEGRPSAEQRELLRHLRDSLVLTESPARFEEILTSPDDRSSDGAAQIRKRFIEAYSRAMSDPDLATKLRATASVEIDGEAIPLTKLAKQIEDALAKRPNSSSKFATPETRSLLATGIAGFRTSVVFLLDRPSAAPDERR